MSSKASFDTFNGSGSAGNAAPASELTLVSVKFNGAVLVCGDCEDRGDGPRKLCARDVRKALKREIATYRFGKDDKDSKDARVRLRIVQCSCLGLCPKKAMALVALRSGTDAPLAAEVKSTDEAGAFGRRLMELSRP